ncbi:MAG: hypothetical protein K0R38_6344 [Polyangiaceae bacterium]|nr:hypothetical protein [Polyangiaceae bacterium]
MAAEWAIRLTPEPFRDFLPYTSLSALKVIHTRKVIEKAVSIIKHAEADRLREANVLSASVRAVGLPIEIASAPVAPLDVSGLSPEARTTIGSRILGLYFHQLQSSSAWFLDLRPRNLAWNDARGSLTFFPSGLWFEPENDFKRRVQALYAGFYRQDRAALATGVELYGWESSPRAGFAHRIELLLREHFGAGNAQAIRFSIAHFRATFDHIFQEAAHSGAKLHPDLTFLGVGLVGLYLTLEQLGVPLDARAAFEASVTHGPVRDEP